MIARHRFDKRVVKGIEHPKRSDHAHHLPGIEPCRGQCHVQRPTHLAFRPGLCRRRIPNAGQHKCESKRPLHVISSHRRRGWFVPYVSAHACRRQDQQSQACIVRIFVPCGGSGSASDENCGRGRPASCSRSLRISRPTKQGSGPLNKRTNFGPKHLQRLCESAYSMTWSACASRVGGTTRRRRVGTPYRAAPGEQGFIVTHRHLSRLQLKNISDRGTLHPPNTDCPYSKSERAGKACRAAG